jgi:hypothetical protein
MTSCPTGKIISESTHSRNKIAGALKFARTHQHRRRHLVPRKILMQKPDEGDVTISDAGLSL